MIERRVLVLISLVALCFLANIVAVFGQPMQQHPQRKLIVGVLDQPPFSFREDDGTWTGITVDLWEEVAKVINVDYEFKLLKPTERVKAVEQGEVDTVATAIVVSGKSEALVDFTDSYLTDNLCVAINSQQMPTMMQVLHSTLMNWGMLLLLGIALCVVLGGATLLWFLEHSGESEHYRGKTGKAFGKSLYWSMTLLMGRELPKATGWSTYPPQTVSGRLFGVAWMFAGTVLISIFTAGVASEFTAKKMQGLVTCPSDLRHVRVGAIEGAPYLKLLDRQHIKYTAYPTPYELMKLLANNRIDAAVYGGNTLTYYAKGTFAGKIHVLDFSLAQGFFALPLQYGSPWRRPINLALIQVLESSKWRKILKQYGITVH